MIRTILAVALAVFLISPVVLAQSFGGKKDEGKKEGAADKKADEKKTRKKTVMPVDRMIRDLKALIAREKAKPEYSKELVKELEALIRTHEKNRKPVKLEDLSEADRKRLTAEVRKQIEAEYKGRAGGRDGGGGGGDWADKVMDAAKLSDEERGKVEGLLTDFAKDAASAVRNGDNKLVKDLKNDLEKQLKKKIGYNKTKKVMNEVNKQFGGRGRGR